MSISSEIIRVNTNIENSINTLQNDIVDIKSEKLQQTPLFANSIEECTDTTKLYVLPDGYIYAYMLTEVVSEPTYTNILPLAVNADGTPYVGLNGEKGYKTGYRLNSSKNEVESQYACCTGFMPVSGNGILRVKNDGEIVIATQGSYLFAFKEDRTTAVGTQSGFTPAISNGYIADVDGVWTIDLSKNGVLATARYIRLSIPKIDENTIITYNEEITESGGTTTGYAWVNTGHAFVPADYEDRIIKVENTTAQHTDKIKALEKAVTSGGTDDTLADALNRIKVWDKPVYDFAPVTLLGDNRIKPALTTSDRTISAIYAKYRALMAEYPDIITETNLGLSSSSDQFNAVDILRFDIKEPDGLTSATYNPDNLHETKPKIIFMSGVHTEWVGVWGLYYAIEEIVTNPDFDDIRRNAHIIVVPCSNPFVLTSQTAIDGWRMSHVNANGVAIHNNFGVDHSTSGTVGAYNYGGTAPYSEPETQYIDKIMADNPDAVAFVSCHNNDYSTEFGTPVIWASSATYHMCNVAFRLIDKLSKAWINKYGDTLISTIDTIRADFPALKEGDYRLGRATMSTSKGTEQKNATKYGIQGVNVEIARMMKVFSGNTDGTSEVMTHGAEVYANLMRTLLSTYDYKDKKEYAPNLPWKE